MNLIFFILISVTLFAFSLYRIFDEVSFNLKDYRDSLVIYNNYTRQGDTSIYKNNLILAPKVKNSYGLIYTNHVTLPLSRKSYLIE